MSHIKVDPKHLEESMEKLRKIGCSNPHVVYYTYILYKHGMTDKMNERTFWRHKKLLKEAGLL